MKSEMLCQCHVQSQRAGWWNVALVSTGSADSHNSDNMSSGLFRFLSLTFPSPASLLFQPDTCFLESLLWRSYQPKLCVGRRLHSENHDCGQSDISVRPMARRHQRLARKLKERLSVKTEAIYTNQFIITCVLIGRNCQPRKA